ncbi:PREDICTED: uncharacterized protein LOC105448711 [Wasmannia auropunctata]|uniref:uncharacterized protein LOC105448711 n=1 Tax=Wasmannia auropunctata TaxID=64793 RepID=UPI0005EFA675|nr:PREDICTED: uncharacterized protein LOC105448711 [Wasmannia auropunctata]
MEVLSDSINYSDSEDDDWFPKATKQSAINEEISDVDCNVENRESEIEEEEESSSDSNNESQVESSSSANTFVTKDGTVWNKLPPAHHQTPLHNIVRQRSGAH